MGDHNTHKIMASNETRLTVALSYLVIYEGLSFNVAQKPSFGTVIDLETNLSKGYQPPNRKLV